MSSLEHVAIGLAIYKDVCSQVYWVGLFCTTTVEYLPEVTLYLEEEHSTLLLRVSLEDILHYCRILGDGRE